MTAGGLIEGLRRMEATQVWADPFPHVVVENFLDPNLAGDLLRTFPGIRALSGWRPVTGNQKLLMRAEAAIHHRDVSDPWRTYLTESMDPEVARQCRRIFAPMIESEYPTLGLSENSPVSARKSARIVKGFEGVLLDSNLLLHTPATRPSLERGPHLKSAHSLLLGYLSLRSDDDRDLGGDDSLFVPQAPSPIALFGRQEAPPARLRLEKVIPRRHNQFYLFLNTPRSFQTVTARGPTESPLLAHHFALQMGTPLFTMTFEEGSGPVSLGEYRSVRRTLDVLKRKVLDLVAR